MNEYKLLSQQKNNLKFQELLSDKKWVAKLAYQADVLCVLNILIISLQGKHKDVYTVRGKTDAFRKENITVANEVG